MQQPVASHSRWLVYLAAILNVRVLLLLGMAILLSSSMAARPVQWLDRLFFSLGTSLSQEQVDTRGYVRIDISAAEMQRYLHDPVSATGLMDLFAQLQQTYTRGTALVLHEPLWRNYASQDFLMTHWHDVSATSKPDVEKVLADMAGRMRIFSSSLVNERNVFALLQEPIDISLDFWSDITQKTGLSSTVQGMRFPVLPSTRIASLNGHSPQADSGNILGRPLLWQAEQGLHPDARLELFMRQQGLRNPQWLPGKGLQLPDHLLRASVNGFFYPRFTAADNASLLRVPHYSLEQLKQEDVRRLLHKKTVVIGVVGDAAADDLVYSVLSLAGGYYAVTPDYAVWLHLGICMALIAYFLIAPILAVRASTIGAVLLLLTMLLSQQILLLVHRDWLPVGQYAVILICGYTILQLWMIRCRYYSAVAGAELHCKEAFPYKEELQSKEKSSLLDKFNINFKVAGNRSERIDPDFNESTLRDTMPMQATVRMSTAPPANKNRSFFGRYQVQRELGRGAMGVVYLGYDPTIKRQVAIKTLHYGQFDAAELPAIKERFLREAEAAGRLDHPNIVKIHDASAEADLAYIAIDYVSGDSLAPHVRRDNLLNVKMVYWIMAQVADAVAYANAQGIIHRDIKPSNILFDAEARPEPKVKVADFGIARIMDGSATRTKTGDILGSPLYMAPEQLKGEPVSARSDVFSLGVTFYQLVTGELPFKGDNFANLSFQIVQGKFKPVNEIRADLPDSARKIINKALQKSPDNRYTTAAEMADALWSAFENKREFS